MALIIADRVKETATTTGTGTFTLGGAMTGFRTFNAGIGTGNTTYYCIFLDGTNEFEVGLGTFTAPNQLARDTVLTSSNSGSKVNFSAGIKSVFCTQPSSKAAFLDASGNLSITTSNITEGSNLYYTDTRFDTRLATKDTANLTEGTNLYFTDARARAAISVSGNALTYNSSTGVISSSFEESPTFTGNVVVSGNLTVTGTTTWLDSTNTQISDKNIILNYASSDSSANADGAGITIQDAVDASTDATLLWNASNDVFEFSHGLDFGDNDRIRLGAGQDLQIYHDGTSSYIKDAGTGILNLLGSGSVRIKGSTAEELLARFNENGSVQLYYNNAEKLATTSTGIDVTGTVVADQIDLGDDENIRLGAGQDLEIFHNSSNNHSVIQESGSGNLRINADDLIILNSAVNETKASFLTDGSVRLFHNNSKKFETTSSGIDVTGGIAITKEDTSGNALLITNNGSSRSLEINHNADNSGIADEVVRIMNNGTRLFTIESDGNVGIGTAAASAKLDINGGTDNNTAKVVVSGNDAIIRLGTNQGGGPHGLQFDYEGGQSNGMSMYYRTTPQAISFEDSHGTSGNKVMVIEQAGNVGIGTAAPSSPNSFARSLQISGTSASLVLEDTDHTTWELGSASGNFKIFEGTSTFLTIDTSGKVGIGTTSPSQPLDIRSASNIQLRLASTTSSNNSRMVFAPNNTEFWNIGTNISDGQFTFFDVVNTTTPFRLEAGAGNNTLVVDSNSRVGIGTTSPASALDVKYDQGNLLNLYRPNSSVSAASLLDFSFNTANSTEAVYARIRADVETNTDSGQGGDLSFHTANSGSVVEKMRITQEGNVGIGTTSPSDGLEISHINPKIRIRESDVTNGFGDILYNSTRLRIRSRNDSNNGAIAFEGQAGSTVTEYARFSNSGNLGIGTTSPSEKLSVAPDTDVSAEIGKAHVGYIGHSNFAGFSHVDRNTTSDYALLQSESGQTFLNAKSTSSGITFRISNSDKMKLDNSGNVLVGKTAVSIGAVGIEVKPNGEVRATSSSAQALQLNRLSTDGTIVDFRKDSTSVGTISVTGSATAYNTSSDARLKDITGSARGLEVINELNPVAYDWKADGKSDEGLIAQEVKELVPNAVSETEEGYYQMDYSKLVTPLIKAVQELTAKVELLETKLADK